MDTSFLKSVPGAVYAVLLVLLCIAPILTSVFDQPFYLDLLTRTLIIAIAAASLNLIIGYGGMISLGHAAFIGIGAYCVGIPSYYDNYNGFVHLGPHAFILTWVSAHTPADTRKWISTL